MYSPGIKTGLFVLEGLNAVATTWYFYYLYFFMEQRFGFGRMENLLLASGLGLLYMVAAMFGGRFGQRRGYFTALKWGFGVLAGSMAVGGWVTSLPGHVGVAAVATLGMCLTWPNLEAGVSEGESPARLQRMVGIYNLVWAGCGAGAFFTGGALLEAAGLRSLFLAPALVHGVQWVLTLWLDPGRSRVGMRAPVLAAEPAEPLHPEERLRSPVSPETFLRMAWLANPFAYLAINTVVAMLPALAGRLGLSPREAGYFCSIWFFVRLAAFVWLWQWTGWHYRFRWLSTAFGLLVVSFVAMLLAPGLGVLLVAQVGFGFAVGLIYYSSLFYSMDVGETKGEHGGLHEAAIGAGSAAGPAIGAGALWAFPGVPASSAMAVGALLCVGWAGLAWLRWSRGREKGRSSVTQES